MPEAPRPEDRTDLDPETARRRQVRIAQVSLLVATLLIAGIVVLLAQDDGSSDQATTSDGDAAVSAGGDEGGDDANPQWPRELGGRPPALGTRGQPATEVAVEPGTAPGVYVWSDFDGAHVWVVNGEGVPPVTGSITSDDTLAKAVPAFPGTGTVEVADKVATFAMPTEPGLVGVDFNPGFFASTMTIVLNGPDGAPIDPALVRVGSGMVQQPLPLVFAKTTDG